MELNFRQSGTGKTLLILHGLFGMLDNWQTLAHYFAGKFEVFNIDLRNHGRSPHSPVHNFQAMARDIYDFMQDQNIYKASFIGHSMGGKTAMQFAAVYPGLVEKLVIVDIFPKVYQLSEREGHFEIFRASHAVIEKQCKSRKEAELEMEKHITDKRVYMFMLKNLVLKEDGTFGMKFNLEALENNFTALQQNLVFPEPVKVPALFIKGGKSGYISEDDILSLNKYFTNAEIFNIPNAGHWIHVDAPEIFKKKVMEFL